MIISPNQTLIQATNSALQKAENAYENIAESSFKTDEVGSDDFNPDDIIKPITSLTEAEFEFSAAVKAIKENNNALGYILDIVT